MSAFQEIRNLIIREKNTPNNYVFFDSDLESYIMKIKNNAEFITYCVDGCCAGFVAFYCNDSAKQKSYITLILTAPEYRGRKIASGLMEGVLSVAKSRGFSSCSLEVRRNNGPALSLYKSKGFAIERETEVSFFMNKILN